MQSQQATRKLPGERQGAWSRRAAGLYGDEAKKPGTFAIPALLARRMVERGVRLVQSYLISVMTSSGGHGCTLAQERAETQSRPPELRPATPAALVVR